MLFIFFYNAPYTEAFISLHVYTINLNLEDIRIFHPWSSQSKMVGYQEYIICGTREPIILSFTSSLTPHTFTYS